MPATFKARVVEWKKMPKWSEFHGGARPIDPELAKYTECVLISEAMLKRSGRTDMQLAVGDIIEIEIIAYAYRMFEHEPKG